MIIERKIGNVNIDVDISKANELYFERDFASTITENGISGIINAIFKKNNAKMMPLSAFIELTSNCNFKCPFCYINEKNAGHHCVPCFEDIKNDLDYLIENGLLYCTLSGGECLLHPDFKKIYRYLKSHGVLVSVFTNGYLIDKEIIELFSELNPFRIEISIYGKDNETYKNSVKVTHVNADQIFSNIIKLKQLGIKVVCKTPITKLTEDSFPYIEKWCQKNDIQFYSGIEMIETYSGTSTEQYRASERICKEFTQKSNELFFNDPTIQVIMKTPSKRKLAFDCSGGKYDVFISSKYMMMPCMSAYKVPEWNFDIHILGIQKAYQMMTEKINIHKNIPLRYCHGCEYNMICQECFMTQYEYKDERQHRSDYCVQLNNYIAHKIEQIKR